MLKKYKPYIISILIALSVGILSALSTKENMEIYEKINRPFLSPPPFVFPVVWSILFVLMGIGSARVYVNRDKDTSSARNGLLVYASQLAVNFLWSIIFFNMQKYLFAFIWLILLWFLILKMIKLFSKVDSIAAYLQIPYLLWVTFAGYLNLMIYLLNR